MATNRPPVAEVFPPGHFIREELAARGWTQNDLATVLGRSVQSVNAIINGRTGITADTAIDLGEAFGTSAYFWMEIQNRYLLHKLMAAKT